METKPNPKSAKIKRTVGFYNMVPNLLWSALSLVPITIFCYKEVERYILLLILIFSVVPAFFSDSLINKLQISKSAITYKKLGVGWVQLLSQNGYIINSILRKKYPGYQAIRWNQKSIKGMLRQTYVFEKFHLALFLFFCLTSVYAFYKGFVGWAVAIL
jgi:hypothetical protein